MEFFPDYGELFSVKISTLEACIPGPRGTSGSGKVALDRGPGALILPRVWWSLYPPWGSYSRSKFQLWGPVSPAPEGLQSRGRRAVPACRVWSRWAAAFVFWARVELPGPSSPSALPRRAHLSRLGLWTRPWSGGRFVRGSRFEVPSG